MRKVDVERDGGCLFRSTAVGLFFQEYGISLGTGTKHGQEKTVQQMTHNVLSRWVRALVVHSMFYGASATIDTVIEETVSLRKVMDDCYSMIQCLGKRYRFKTPREARWNKRHFLYHYHLRGRSHEDFMYEPGGVPLHIISMSGREENEPHGSYCRRMASLDEWGGESEIYVISQILKYAVTIYGERRKILQRYVPMKVNGVLNLSFLANEEHYMVMI